MAEPRIPPLPQEEWTDAAREVFAYWEGEEARENGSKSNTMMTLAQHPKLAMASLDLGKYFMLESTLAAREQKMIVLRVAHRYDSTYQWTHNSLGALQVGFTEEEIQAVRKGPGDPIWGTLDRLMLIAVDEVGDGGRLSEATWLELSEHFSREKIMDLIHATGFFTMVAWGLIAMGVQVEPDFASFSRNRAKEG